jgi:citrate lyase subunit beta/citryl-CoA lyase
MKIQPRRSVLYVPADNPRALEKAAQLPADCLIFDLEDSVAPEQKESARAALKQLLAETDYGQRELIVRVNGLDTPWGAEDLQAFAKSPIDVVLLPKVEDDEQLQKSASLLEKAAVGGTPALWIMAETPAGILNIRSLAAAHPRLQVIVMGTSDLAKDLRVPQTPNRSGLLHALGECVLAARANGLDIIDGVHIDLKDEAGFINACQQGRELGFDGKTLIHPGQLEGANEVFAPSEQELDAARQILEGWETARKAGDGVTMVNGRLVEELHVAEARRLLALGDAIAALTHNPVGGGQVHLAQKGRVK